MHPNEMLLQIHISKMGERLNPTPVAHFKVTVKDIDIIDQNHWKTRGFYETISSFGAIGIEH